MPTEEAAALTEEAAALTEEEAAVLAVASVLSMFSLLAVWAGPACPYRGHCLLRPETNK